MELTQEQKDYLKILFDSAWTWYFLGYAWVANRFNEKYGTRLYRNDIKEIYDKMISAG